MKNIIAILFLGTLVSCNFNFKNNQEEAPESTMLKSSEANQNITANNTSHTHADGSTHENHEEPEATTATSNNHLKAEIKVLEPKFDFGAITEGDVVSRDFKIKNTGKAPLVISNVKASCGCTVPEKPTDPILPGQEDVIKVTFNSKGRVGNNRKVVTISSNADNSPTKFEFNVLVNKAKK